MFENTNIQNCQSFLVLLIASINLFSMEKMSKGKYWLFNQPILSTLFHSQLVYPEYPITLKERDLRCCIYVRLLCIDHCTNEGVQKSSFVAAINKTFVQLGVVLFFTCKIIFRKQFVCIFSSKIGCRNFLVKCLISDILWIKVLQFFQLSTNCQEDWFIYLIKHW